MARWSWLTASQEKDPTPVEQFEYLRVNVGEEPELDSLGAKGWELVTISPEHYVEAALQRSRAPASFVFKRRLKK